MNPTPRRSVRQSAADALAKLPDSGGERFVRVFEHGTLEIEIYAPRGRDPQEPHDRDELYFVVSGRGEFVHAEERTSFGPGDVLFVAAGVIHRFEKFTDDLAVWVAFYGPRGGEP